MFPVPGERLPEVFEWQASLVPVEKLQALVFHLSVAAQVEPLAEAAAELREEMISGLKEREDRTSL